MGRLREDFWRGGQAVSRVRKGKEAAGAKFADYFDWSERLERMPSHRILALFRGEKEEILDLDLAAEGEDSPVGQPGPFERAICHRHGVADRGRPGDAWLLDTVRGAWRTKIRTGIKQDLRTRLFERAEVEAVKVFAGNLKDLLLAAPAGGRATLGLDPGYRNGVKVAVVDATGKVVAVETTYPTSRSAAGRIPCRPSRASAGGTRWSCWPSATAPPPARPTALPPRFWRPTPTSG